MNWGKIGTLMAPYIVSIIISVAVCALAFRRWIAPSLVDALEKASKTSATLAGLGGLKKDQWLKGNELEKAVTTDLLHDRIPELQALKLILSPSTWEQIEEMIDENPAAVMQLYEKWRPYLGGAEQKQEQYMF